MERRLTEENVTIAVIKWLKAKGWSIVCYDFPQSGTGVMLHPDCSASKNEGGIVPDIVAVRGDVALYFENKDRFSAEDCHKLHKIKVSGDYDKAFRALFQGDYDLKVGIAFPKYCYDATLLEAYAHMVDFAVVVGSDTSVTELKFSADASEFDLGVIG